MSFFKTQLDKARLCIIHRRIPFRYLFGVDLVDTKWRKKLDDRLALTDKIKVGFGPVVSGEDDLNVRKWRIDPIVDRINETSEKYCAGIFLNSNDAERFDVVVIVKGMGDRDHDLITMLKNKNKKIILDIVDMPYRTEDVSDYTETERIFQAVDGFIVSSPLTFGDLGGLGKKMALIEHPVLNTIVKDYSRENHGPIRIIWQGYQEHHKRMEFLHPLIQRLSGELGKKITITYHTNVLPKRSGLIRYKTWTIYNWETTLVQADIAVEVKLSDDPYLQRKPSTKIILYAAAGLPIVCTPSVADRLVIEHGKTGYFVESDEEWYLYLKKLIEDADLRENIGLSARDKVIKHFNIREITRKYLAFFDEIK